MARRRKSFPPVPASASRDLQALLKALIEVSEVGDGVRGDSLDRKVTVRELVDGGIVKRRQGARPGGSGGSDFEPNQPPPDMARPPLPKGFYAVGSFWGRIDLSWTIPSELYGNHGYTNIYRADTDNLANAQLIGREVGMFYTDTLRNDTIGDGVRNTGAYYWIRFVSSAGVEGPPNKTAGTYAAPIDDVTTVLETLSKNLQDAPVTAGSPSETMILNARRFAFKASADDGSTTFPFIIDQIGGKATVVLDTALIGEGSIQQGQLGAISSGKIIGTDGKPITTVGGLLRADQIDANNLSVAKASTFTGTASSANYNGTQGWLLSPTGTAVFGNGTIIQGNAEFRSGNLRDDVMIANTDSLGIIRQRAYAGSQAKDRADQWTRPGTTNINGNQIYTGDAYVDTLQIKGQAVTIANIYNRSSRVYPADNRFWGFEEVGSVYCNPEGGQITVLISVTCWMRGFNEGSFASFRAKVGNETFEYENAVNGYINSSDDTPYAVTLALQSRSKSGSTKVSLEVKSDRTYFVTDIFISAQGYKR